VVTGKTKKTKHRLIPEGTDIWALAGLWEPRTTPDGQKGAAFVVLTTAAHSSIAYVHDRMPCIIRLEQASAWLDRVADGLLTQHPGRAEAVPP
jgi:putative SOS response-associated peptidase YedK